MGKLIIASARFKHKSFKGHQIHSVSYDECSQFDEKSLRVLLSSFAKDKQKQLEAWLEQQARRK